MMVTLTLILVFAICLLLSFCVAALVGCLWELHLERERTRPAPAQRMPHAQVQAAIDDGVKHALEQFRARRNGS